MKFIIVFQFFYYEDSSFNKRYFQEWNTKGPLFTENIENSMKYLSFDDAQKDLEKLEKAQSPVAKTLNVRIVRSD